jgi:hypothetical protein
VVVTALPSATISYSSAIFCKNLTAPQNVILTGTPGGVFSSTPGLSIQPGTGAIVPSTSSMGVYTVNYTIAAGGGCPAVTASTSVFINPMPDPAGVITSANNDTVNPGEMNLSYTVPAITNTTSYIWRYSGSGVTFVPDSITMSNSVMINFGPGASSGILTVRGHNTCGEGDPSAGFAIFVTIGIEEMANQQKYRIHPNPTAGKVEIRLPKPVYGLEISIITSEGKVVLSQNNTTITDVVLMDLTGLPAGLYLMKLSGQGFSGTERIVVQ